MESELTEKSFKCNIEFERKVPIYFSGEPIRGMAEVIGDFDPSQYDKKFEMISEYWVDYLWFANDTGDSRQYKFVFHIPPQTMTSCCSKIGSLQYELKFILRKWKRGRLEEHLYSRCITIIRPLDLNQYHQYRIPWVQSLNSHIKLELPHTGYVPGQSIHFRVIIQNRGVFHNYKNIDISLKQLCHYFKKNVSVLDSLNLSLRDCDMSHKPHTLTGSLRIPRGVAISTKYHLYRQFFEGIHVSYVIVVKMNTPFLGRLGAKIFSKEITIGTVPLEGSLNQKTETPESFCSYPNDADLPFAYIPNYGSKLIYAGKNHQLH